MGCVYLATNRRNGKCYVGKTILGLRFRRKDHEKSSKKGSDLLFHRALRKYGFDSFDWDVIVESDDPAELIRLEIENIKWFNCKVPNGYNLTDGGEGKAGWEMPEEMKKKIGDRNRGSKHPRSKDYCIKMSLAKMGNTPSTETREKIRRSLLGKSHSEETKKKMRDSHRGKPHSEVHKARIAEALKGKPGNMLGKHLSDEAKAKISMKNKGRKHTEETRKKISEARRRNNAA